MRFTERPLPRAVAAAAVLFAVGTGCAPDARSAAPSSAPMSPDRSSSAPLIPSTPDASRTPTVLPSPSRTTTRRTEAPATTTETRRPVTGYETEISSTTSSLAEFAVEKHTSGSGWFYVDSIARNEFRREQNTQGSVDTIYPVILNTQRQGQRDGGIESLEYTFSAVVPDGPSGNPDTNAPLEVRIGTRGRGGGSDIKTYEEYTLYDNGNNWVMRIEGEDPAEIHAVAGSSFDEERFSNALKRMDELKYGIEKNTFVYPGDTPRGYTPNR